MKINTSWINFGTKTLKRFLSGRVFASQGYGLSDLLMYAKMIDDGIILQTDGSFLIAFWYRGSDLETSTDEELAILSAQLNSAFNLLGSGWLFHIDMIRYSATGYTPEKDCCFSNATSLLIDAERRELYQNEDAHYENVYVVSFTYRPRIDFGSRLGLFFRRENTDNKQNGIDYSYYLKQFKGKVNEISELLTEQLNLVQMNSQSLLSYISWCLTGEVVDLKVPVKYGVFLKHFLASKDLVGGENPKIGDKFIRAVTIMGFPSESYPGILDRLNYVDFEYRFNTRFIMIGQYEGSRMIDKIANLWYQKRISAMDTIKMSLAIDSNVKVNQNSNSQFQDAESAKLLNDTGDVKFGFYTATVILTDDDSVSIERNAAHLRNIFRSLGFQSQVERHHGIEAYLGSLPGYSYANVRKWLIHSLNVADIMPNTSIWSGLTYNPCSFYTHNNPPLFYARTNGHTPLRISLHVADNGHSLIVGPTGSGKSTLLNFIIAQHFRYQNSRVFVFDKNRSSLPLCYSCNGRFYDIGEEENSIYFQPLANLENDLDFDFAANWLEEVCCLNGLMGKFDDTHRRAIRKALQLMQQETPVERRTISYFRHLVQDYAREVANVLDGFSSESRNDYTMSNTGFINKIFDASDDVVNLDQSRFTVFEMAKLMEQGDRVIIPALRYLIHTISKRFDSGEPTLMIFDESFLFFKHELFRDRIIEWIKTVRKFNVAIVFATSELTDLLKYDDLRSALKTNCATKIFLPNRRATNPDIYVQYKSMDLNQKQIELIAMSRRGEYFYTSDLGNRKFTLDLDEKQATYAFVARTSQQDVKQAMALKQQDKKDFAYHWLNACNVAVTKQDQWREYFKQLNN